MSLPLNRRDFDLFLSHAHKDSALVERLDAWLTETVGATVWLDRRELPGGAMLATVLQAAIGRCRGVIIVASDEALRRGWVQNEYNAAMDERANVPGFRGGALRVGNADTSMLMKGTTWIDVPVAGLDNESAAKLLRAIYPVDKSPTPGRARDVYLSCSWQKSDKASAVSVSKAIARRGFRLIGDARDQKGFNDGDRVEQIMSSCGAFVGVIPYRGDESLDDTTGPYKYFLREIALAESLNLPRILVVDPRLNSNPDWLEMRSDTIQCPSPIEDAIDDLWESWVPPSRPHYIFYALDLESESARARSDARDLLERITGMPTVVGSEIHDRNLHSAVIDKIANAFLVVADISDDNINSCIEAGMAIAVKGNIEIISAGEARRPPFMLRSLQLRSYRDDVEHLGTIARIARPYRRRVINSEL